MRIKVTADSTCDLSPAQIQANNIQIFPLTVMKDGVPFLDGVDITPEDIFAHVEAGGALCSTAAVNVETYRTAFQVLSQEYDAVIHINIGSGFSACYQDACLAAEGFPNVRVIDSENLSTGQGLIVMAVCRALSECRTMADVDTLCAKIRALTGRVEASFLIDRLNYMVKGGRCSSAAALGANLLNLKPCIEVVNGQMKVVRKYRGSYAKCLSSYIKDRLDGRMGQLEQELLFVTHTPMEQQDMDAVRSTLTKYSHFSHTEETDAGCTVSCHCGPHTLGILFIRKE